MKIILIAAVIALIIAVDRWMTWKINFYACFAIFVKKEMPTPSTEELMESRQWVINNYVDDLIKKH